MPNRIIKESICTSDTIAELTWFEQVLFFRLIVLADDYGVFDGRAAIIRGKGFALTNVTDKQIKDGLKKLESVGIVYLYEVNGKPYLQIKTWEDHQRVRNSTHKYPTFEQADNSPQLAADCGFNPNPNPNPNTHSNECVTRTRAKKNKYGEYGHVLLSDTDYQKLHDEYSNADEAIAFLDEYIEYKGYTAKNHYLAMKKWVFDALAERKKDKPNTSSGSFDTDDFFRSSLEHAYDGITL